MTYKPLDTRQSQYVDALTRITNVSGSLLKDIVAALDVEITPPFAMSCTGTDLVLHIATVNPANPSTGVKKTIRPIVGTIPTFTSGTVTFPSASGGTATVSPGATNPTITISSGNYLKVGISISTVGNIVLTFGTQNTSIATAGAPNMSTNSYFIGYVVLFNNAGTIQNLTGSSIYQTPTAYADDNPLTTKGDIYTFDGTNYARLPVSGTNGNALVADSTQTTGLNWANVLTNPMTTQGDMVKGGVSGASTRLPFPGAAGYVLNSSASDIAWSQTPLSTGILSTDAAATNLTVPSGQSLLQPNLIINSGVTYTINGSITVLNSLTVNGTLTLNGPGRVI